MKMAGVCLGHDNKPYRLIRAAMQRTGEEAQLPIAYTVKRVRFQTKVFAEVGSSP